MKTRKLLCTVLAFILVALTVFSLASCKNSKDKDAEKDPLQYAFDSIASLLNLGSEEKLGEFEKGSVEFKVSGIEEFLPSVENISLKEYFSKDMVALFAEASLSGKKVDLKGYLNSNKIAVSSSILGSTVYGIDLNKISENLSNSIFKDMFAGLENSAVSLGQSVQYNEFLSKSQKASEIFERYGKVIVDQIKANSNAVFTKNDDGKVVTAELTNDGMKKIVTELYKTAKSDAELRDFVNSYVTYLAGTEAVDAMKEYDDFFADEAEFNEMISDAFSTPFSVKFTLNNDKEDVVKTAELVIKATADGEQAGVTVSLDATVQNKVTVSLKIEEGDGVSNEYKLVFETLADTKDEYKASVSVQYGAVTVSLFDINVNKKDGSYELSTMLAALAQNEPSNEDYKISLSGKYNSEKDKFELSVNKFKMSEMNLEFNVDVIINLNDEMPAYPENVKELLTMTEGEAMDMMTEIQNNLEDLGLDGLFGGQSDSEDYDYDLDYDVDYDLDYAM